MNELRLKNKSRLVTVEVFRFIKIKEMIMAMKLYFKVYAGFSREIFDKEA